jgi:hypothetical protein
MCLNFHQVMRQEMCAPFFQKPKLRALS